MLSKLIAVAMLLNYTSFICAQDSEESNEKEQSSKRPSWSEGLPERSKVTDLNRSGFKPKRDKEELDMSEFGLQQKPEIDIDLPIKPDLQRINVDVPNDAIQEAELESIVEQNTVEQPVIEEPVIEQTAIEQAVVEQTVIEDEPIVETVEAIETVPEASLDSTSVTAVEQSATVETADDEDSLTIEQEVNLIPEEQSIALVEPPVQKEPDFLTEDEGESKPAKFYKWNILTRTDLKYPVKALKDKLEGWVEVEITINSSGEVVSAEAINYSRRGKIFGKPENSFKIQTD